jgi:multidrug efflux pump subunit AcrA (membrane-fusion protein)
MSGNHAESSTAGTATNSQSLAAIDVAGHIGQMAAQAGSREEFLQLVAAALGEWLSAALVAVSDSNWEQSRMLVRDDAVAAGIDREQIRHLLDNATPAVASTAIVCDATDGLVMATAPKRMCGGLTAELLPKPQRCSLLVVQSSERSASEMLPAMRLLATAVTAVQNSRFQNTAKKQTDNHDANRLPEQPTYQNLIDTAELNQLAAVRASLRRFHESLDPTATAYTIASELPRLLPCDRAVVLMPVTRRRRNRKYHVTAISGSSTVDRRSPLVRTMNNIATRLAVLGSPLVLPSISEQGQEDLPPQIVDSLEEYLDESGVLSVTVLPIHEPERDPLPAIEHHSLIETATSTTRNVRRDGRPPMAMILLETFSGTTNGSVSQAMIEIGREASTAIGNALRYDDVFALPLRRPFAGLTRAAIRNWFLAIVLLLVGFAAASWFIRVDHTIVASGVARPMERRAVFATVDGVVEEIMVKDGQRVTTGEVLVKLENAEIARETESLSGQLATATEKLASLRAMQLAGSDDPREVAQNVIEQGALESEIRTLGGRLKLNETLQQDLTIRSPMDGHIVGWRLGEKLRSRPVSRGDRLFVVVAADGPWELDLKLDESKAGEVMQLVQSGQDLPVRFAIASQPTRTYQAIVTEIGGVARRRADASNVVDVVARVQRSQEQSDRNVPLTAEGFRGDVDVTAKLVCAPRRLIDSLSDELVAWVHRNILFRFR